jgi:LMBR1 domain-containing protein 1
MLAIIFMVGLTVGLSFYFLGISDVPVQQYQMSIASLLTDDHTNAVPDQTGLSTPLTNSQASAMSLDISQTSDFVRLNVTFGLYLLAIMAFVGWFLFVIFAGLGIPGMTIDLIRDYKYRPKRLDRGQINALELAIQRRCKELVEIGDMLKSTRTNSRPGRMNYIAKRLKTQAEVAEFKRFKQMVYLLEEDYKQLNLCKAYSTKYNPLLPIFWLIVGILFGIIGILWITHIILYMLISPAVTNFLNNYFTWFDYWFPLFGAISVALFSIYLLIVTVKGCFKFGLRLMWFTLHPMKLNETYMNSFLFNVGIILMCVPAVIQFCVQAFSAYAVSADINGFINVQVRYLRFFRYFYSNDVFIYALLIMTLLATIFLSIKPADTSASTRDVREALRKLTTEGVSR